MLNGELPPVAQEGELSVREKATEIYTGVYVTRLRSVPLRIGKTSLMEQVIDSDAIEGGDE